MFKFNWETISTNLGFAFIVIWEAFWKAIALWKSAKRGDLWWFIPIFLINLFGIIPIFYLWRTKQFEETVNDTLRFLRLKKS